MFKSYLLYFVLASGIYHLVMVLLMKTNTILAAFVFKVFPFFLALGCVLYFLVETSLVLTK